MQPNAQTEIEEKSNVTTAQGHEEMMQHQAAPKKSARIKIVEEPASHIDSVNLQRDDGREAQTYERAGENTRQDKFWRKALGRLLQPLDLMASWLIINLTSFLAFFLYRVFNRTRVYGRKNVGTQRNTLIMPNHRTMIDSYLVGHLSSWPTGFIKPHVLPYHPAAEENFFRNRCIGWFSSHWRCIPVKRGCRDFRALEIMSEKLPKSHMVLFPEGSRSRDGKLKRGRPGSGKLIKDTGCRVIPCYVQGMEKVLPIGKAFPRFFNSITVIFGEAIPLDDLRALPDGKETSQKIIDRVMSHIAQLKDDLHNLEEERARKRASRRRAAQRVFTYPAQIFRRIFMLVR